MFHTSSHKLVHIFVLIFVINSVKSAQEKRCIPFSRCQEVKWIAESEQTRLPINTNAFLSQVACGFNGEPLVWCSVGTIEESSQYGIFDMTGQSQCLGQLKIYTAMNNALQIFRLRTGRLYRNLNRLSNIYRSGHPSTLDC